MPIKPLPPSLVRRLQRASAKIELALPHMQNKDHRTRDKNIIGIADNDWGYRVKGMNVKRNYPKTKLIIKRAQTGDARYEIRYVQLKVRDYNRLPVQSRKDCVLLMPKAYVISNKLIAMREAQFPAATELVHFAEYATPPTPRGDLWRKRLEDHGIDVREFRRRMREMEKLTGIAPGNLMVLGVRNNQLVLMPLVDHW